MQILKKTIVITFAIIVAASIQIKDTQADEIKRIRGKNFFITQDQKPFQFPYINLPTKDKNDPHHCHYKKSADFLKKNLLGKTVTTKLTKDKKTKLLLNGEDLAEILLDQGLAFIPDSTLPLPRSYSQREAQTKKQQRGLWQHACDLRSRLSFVHKNRRIFSPTLSHSGRVTAILDEKTLQLADKRRITLAGIRTIPTVNTNANTCFKKESIRFLEQSLLGQQILAEPLTKNSPIFLVWRQTDSINQLNPPSFNEIIIKAGYGKAEKIRVFFADIQAEVYKSPRGAWKTCLPAILKTKNQAEPIDCTIKGNITGSKKSPIKKYHTVKSPWYERTVAETCFNSENDAEAAGFVKVK